jgi:hypothetical protein
MRRGAPSTVVSPCRCLVTAVVRPSRQCPSVCSAELSYCGSTRWRLAGGACGERPSGRASLRRPGMPGRRPCRPSPARVHRWVSTHPVPTSGVRSSNRPVSSRPVSSRPVSGQLVPSSGIRLSGRPVSARRRPAGWCPRVRPITSVSSASARRWPWRSRRCGGQSSQPGRIELPVVGGVPSGLVGRRVGLEGDGGEVVGRPVGERRSRTWPGRARAEAAVTLHR